MKFRTLVAFAILVGFCGAAYASDPKLDGAYRFVSIKFEGGGVTDAQQKGLLVVHGKYMAFVRSAVNRKTWGQNDPEEEVNKKIVEAFNGVAATAGSFVTEGDTISLTQVAQAVPSAMGTTSKWQYKLDGKKLTLKPAGIPNVEFTFERVD